MRLLRLSCFALPLALATAACPPAPEPQKDAGAAPSAVSSTGAADDAGPEERRPAPVREGGAIVRSASSDAPYIADEDHGVVRVVPLPLRTEGEAPDGGSAPIASEIAVLGGNQEGLLFWIDPPKDKNSEMPGGGEVMFPLRHGDRRVIQISTFGQGDDGPFTILPAVIIQEQWVQGDPAPTVTAM